METYMNTKFDFASWTGSEQFCQETIDILQRERITTPEALLRLEEEDIKDLNLRIGERAIFRAALKTLKHAAAGVGGGSRKPAPPVPASPVEEEPHYETIPYERFRPKSCSAADSIVKSPVVGESHYANVAAENDYTLATSNVPLMRPKRRAPPPPPTGSPVLRPKSRLAPPPPDDPMRPRSNSRSSSYVIMDKVSPKVGDDPMGALDEPTFQKEQQYTYLTRTDANLLLRKHPTLSAKFDIHDKAPGQAELRVSLTGWLPYSYKGSTYRIPVTIWLDKRHPYNKPVVYVTPSDDMTLNPGPFVDQAGLVSVPYLKKWMHPESNLVGLVDSMGEAFTKFSPVYAKLPGK